MSKAQAAFGRVDTVELVNGIRVRCHPLCTSEFGVFTHDKAQRDEMIEFIQHCTPGMQLLDVGSHWGVFTLATLQVGGPSARTLCIEASAAAADVLQKNLVLNGVADRVILERAAAGSLEGTLKMLTTGAGGADFVVVPTEPRSDTVEIRQVTVDSVCESKAFTPTHFKMDIEGFEEEGLLGSEKTLRNGHATLFLELHGDQIRARGKDPLAVLGLVKDFGYTKLFLNGKPVNPFDLANEGFNARLRCEK